jgi:hypothetical protein
MAGVTAVLERRCGAWNVHAVFMLARAASARTVGAGGSARSHGHDDQKCRGATRDDACQQSRRRARPDRIILKSCECNARLQIRIRQLTVLSTIGINPAAAFNRVWQREDILNARFEKLFELNTTALILDEALSTPRAERERRANRVIATRRVREVESVASTRNGNDTGADMRSVLSLAMFAIGVLCFVAFVTEVRPVSIIAAPSPSEQVRVQ